MITHKCKCWLLVDGRSVVFDESCGKCCGDYNNIVSAIISKIISVPKFIVYHGNIRLSIDNICNDYHDQYPKKKISLEKVHNKLLKDLTVFLRS